jgi:hypothetical protein
MTEQALFKVSGTIMGLGAGESSPQRSEYKEIWVRGANDRDTTIRQVSAARHLSALLAADKVVTLYFVRSPSGQHCLFAIDDGAQQADDIDAIGQSQAKARKAAIKLLIVSVPLCLVLVGFLLLPLTIRGLILLSKAPKPQDMRAFLAAG